jgi:putative CocE/NonD family hydrolase
MPHNNTLPLDPEQKVSLDEHEAEDASRWSSADTWPPPGIGTADWHLAPGPSGSVSSVNDGVLASSLPKTAAADSYTVDFTSSSGQFNRWRNGYGSRREEPEHTTFFDERSPENKKALTYTSEPMAKDTTLLGYPVVHLWVSSSHTDGDFFVYLEEVDADGRSHYLTEGALRASYRKLKKAPIDNFGLPFVVGLEAALADLPDEPVELVFDLMGLSHVIQAGHRLRVTITGADAANHELHPDPAIGAPTITVHLGGEHASYVELPVFEAP